MQNCGMALLQILKNLFGTRKLSSPKDLQSFLESRSAFVVQKSITEYAQARANMMFSTLLGEKTFQKAYEEARWKSFPAGLSAVAELMAGALRTRLNLSPAEASAVMAQAARRLVTDYPVPEFADETYWAGAIGKLEADLARAELGQVRPAHAIAQTRATEVFDALPFHSAIKKHDFDMFRNTLSFHLAEIATELEESRLDPSASAKI